MSRDIRNKTLDRLFDAVLTLQNREECYRFFEDICTANELISISQRLEVARMLREKKTYLEIAENYGKDGYGMVFERLNEN